MVYVSTETVPSQQGIIDTQYTGHSDVINEDDGTYIIVQPQQPGVATEIKQRGEARQSLKRRDATIHPGLVPLQAPANTPAMGIPQHPRSHRKIEYEEIVVTDQRRESRTSSNSDINAALIAAGNNSYVRKTSLDGSVQKKKAKSVVSSHSSDRKPKLFEAVLPGDDLSQKQNSSFYGGAMPITSNLVKQTLSDKVSILSASQPGTESISGHSGSYRHDATKTPRHSIGGPSIASKGRRQSDSKVSEPVVPLIGVEPATPLHPVQASPHQLTPQPKKQYLSPGNSLSGSHRSSHKSSQRSIGGQSLQGSSGGQKSQRSLGGQEESFGGQGSEKGSQYSDSDRESKRRPSKKSDGSDNDESDNSDDFSKSSQSSDQKSSKHEVASKYSQTTKSKSKPGSIYSDESASLLSKKQSIESKVEAPYYGLKGAKGPGSQSSSSILKSTSSKKSKSTRGSIPSAMKRDRHTASVRMPGGKIVPVGGSLARSSDKELTEVSESEEEVQSSKLTSEIKTQIRPKPAIKSGKSSEITSQNESSTRSDLKVTFKRDDVATDTGDEDVTSIHEEDYDVTEEEEEQEQEWPDVKEEVVSIVKSATSSSSSRPISSRSDILTAHARKVAAKVIKKQRPKSGLDEDAKQAAELWNKALSSSEEKSESEEETEEEEEWGVKEQPTAVSSVKVESQHILDEKKNRLKKIINEGKKEREIRPSVSTATPTKKQPSVTASMTSQSSAPSSVSSVQEEFVAEIQKKASDLGIEAKELTFEADVIDKLEKSDIRPEEVEVFHDKEAGRHIVRSRHSSATASSVLTPSSEEPGEQSDYKEATKKKPKLVVDLKIEDKAPESISRASSISTSVSSHSYQRTARSRSSSISPERKRPSIPVEKSQVVLDYDVTTYEGKLGDPKTEEPTIQSGRPHVEPEKIKVTTDRAQKLDEKDKSLADKRKTSDLTSKKGKPGQKLLNNVPGAASVAESVNSEKSSSKGTKAKSVTKGPQRAGKPGVKQAVGKASIDSKGEVDSVKEELTEEEKLQRDLAKLTDGQKTKKADGKRKKGAKGKSKAVDSVASEKDSSITSKTPEKAKTKTPEKLAAKTPETPFRAGQPDKKKQIEEPLPAATPDEKAESIASSKPKKSQKGKKKEPVTQVQISQSEKPAAQSVETEEKPEKIQSAKSLSPNKGGEEEEEHSSPVESPVDDYVFVRKEDTPEPTPDPTPEPAEPEVKMDDTKSQISEVTEATEATEASSQAAIAAAEDEAEREAKKAAKAEREAKRAAAAERRRLEVERKRKEKEEQIRKEKEELERKEQMKEEFEAEGRRREEAAKLRKEEAEKAKQQEVEEEENRKRRLEIQQERERKQLEEKRRKIEEIQRKKREEEERRKEEARLRALEEEQKRKEEEELMAQMEEDEREQYAERKRIEEEERKVREEERRRREQEEARIMMEQAKLQAIARAKQQAEVEEKLRFIREFFQEAQGLDNTQNVNRSFTFSYFELMQMLGLDVPVE
nr:titin homolog isoform X1 [Ciona intestinalis]|eukprot:XP_026693171.1 titin homolog isoform X1 [Ciona intestinalis]